MFFTAGMITQSEIDEQKNKHYSHVYPDYSSCEESLEMSKNPAFKKSLKMN